jgi:2-hydroxycyclohexanecarboxyl-CoA dehydrogenase
VSTGGEQPSAIGSKTMSEKHGTPVTDNDLERRVALVTGGGAGIGRAICLCLAAAGAVAIVADIDKSAAEQTVALILNRHGRGLAVHLDVTDAPAIAQVAGQLTQAGCPPDVLVNNAGLFAQAPLAEIDEDAWDRMMEVNLKGPFMMMQAFLPHMLTQGWGRVVSVSSTAGKTGEAFASHYSASKRALIALSQAVALEVAPAVTINCVCPGIIFTEMTKAEVEFRRTLGGDQDAAAIVEAMSSAIPLRRLGTPSDVASAVGWLCSPAAGYVTGQAINIDGGLDFH